MKYSILFFPWRDWNKMKKEGFRTREANILLELLKRDDVDKIICVNRSKVPKYLEKLLEFKEKENHFKDNYNQAKEIFNEKVIDNNLFSKLIEINEKLYILDINYHLPNPKGNKLEQLKLFRSILESEIKKSLNFLKVSNYIVWSFDLSRVFTANHFKKELFIFDAIDNLLEHNDFKNDKKNLENKYYYVKEHADIIFTVSKDIRSNLFGSVKKSYYVPNGIKLDAYRKDNMSGIPNDIPSGKPIIGYVGLMQERIDVDQLEELVRGLKQCNFVFVGPVLDSALFNQLKNNDNVFFLGAKHHSLIPSYINSFDICIIPHKVNKFTNSMNPLKLYEYLAAGKEVISTPVPPYESFQNVIHVANNTRNMKEIILGILSKPYSKFSREDISNKIVNETWKNRINYMFSKIEEKI